MTNQFDALIIGTGISGMVSALTLAESGLSVALVSREKDPNITNTYYAQGGIIYPQKGDPYLSKDIQKASSKTSNLKAVELLEKVSGKILKEILLDKVNIGFFRDEKGELLLTREGAHSLSRILFTGDFTGREIQTKLLNYLKDKERFPNVTILTECTAVDLLTPLHHGKTLGQRYEQDKVVGAYLFDQKSGQVNKVIAKVTVLATGGAGALYLHHSNSEGARGDGLAMANRAGAFLTDMEFIQFHPTTFFNPSSHRRFLISEAVRGEGGILLNGEGKTFMHKYHPDEELAPRDVVSNSIISETLETKHECVYLDISHKNTEWIKKRFPTIYLQLQKFKIDMTKDPIPVIPAAHYTCGGVKTDLSGRTNLKNLYAVGEVACTGLHGANRLASTSLMEGLVFGHLAAKDIIEKKNQLSFYPQEKIKDWDLSYGSVDFALINQDWLTLKQTMWNYVGLTRTTHRLRRAEAMFSELYHEISKFYKNASLNDDLIGLRNAVEVASTILQSSLRNKQSVGCFLRKD